MVYGKLVSSLWSRNLRRHREMTKRLSECRLFFFQEQQEKTCNIWRLVSESKIPSGKVGSLFRATYLLATLAELTMCHQSARTV